MTCPKCGIVHDEDFAVCLGGAVPSALRDELVPAGVGPQGEPSWRREVSERLESYRARRERYRPGGIHGALRDDSQGLMTFHAGDWNRNGRSAQALDEASAADRQEAADEEADHSVRRAALRVASRQRRTETVEIMVSQPHFDFSASEEHNEHPQDEKRPVADLRERRRAACYDGFIIAATCAGFFLAYHMSGGEFLLTRYGLAVYAATAYLVYGVYFVLFTVYAGMTPGMLLRGLEVVGFDGKPPSPRAALWRSFGYLLGAAAGFLGFLWACWDDQHLTWQDRISETYLTAAEEEACEEESAERDDSERLIAGTLLS